MTFSQAAAIVDGKDYRNPQYREARLFLHHWRMEHDETYRTQAERIDDHMRKDFIRAGLLNASDCAVGLRADRKSS